MNMYEMLSFKQHGQRKKFFLLGSLLFFLMVLFVSISICTSQPMPSHITTVSKAKTVVSSSPCKDTLYPEACQSLILSSKDDVTPTIGDMFSLSIKSSIDQAHATRSLAFNVTQMTRTMLNSNSRSHLDDCVELLDQSLDQLGKIHMKSTSEDDIQTWLSAAITHQTFCLDGFETEKLSKGKATLYANLRNNIQHISNSLALHKSLVTEQAKALKGKGRRRLLSDDFPAWVSSKERKLLETPIEELETSAKVALDGTGTHKTISEALAFVSLAGTGGGRKVIHVAAGTYSESSLGFSLQQSNVMLVGDGKGLTVITGSKSASGGASSFSSATFGVSGDGFIARDISFVNNAGPGKGQAVALRVTSDRSVFYRCSIQGYQDTLYTLSNRQFYRESDVYGTVDFIFGNSAVVLQNCNILARKYSERSFITAQGRSDPNQNTGISIHKCKIQSDGGNTYLGRPWKTYSRTVVMQSYLDGTISSAGWYPWSGSSSLNTLYYGEYSNTGPGASTSGRVRWGGVHSSMSPAEASKFTVASLISGNSWLPSTGVIFDAGL